MDGNEAAATASFPFVENSFIYPITPSTSAAETVEKWAAEGKKNIFGNVPVVREMQSEGGVAAAVHGAGVSGSLTSTYTSSQGLLLMVPAMYKIAYEMIPCVIHVASRLVAYHAMCLYCDYSDVYACRDTGFAFLASADPQECLDLGTIAHLVSCKTRIPFLHFYDGLRTSHSIQKIATFPEQTVKDLFPYAEVQKWRETAAMSTDHPSMRGCGQNSDIWWSCSEATAPFFRAIPGQVQEMMNRFAEKVGRQYHLVDYYGAPDATDVIVLMGSAANTAIEVVQYINKTDPTRKVGVIKVRLFRPFPSEALVNAIPATCQRLCVLDRVKQTPAAGEPMYMETLTSIQEVKPELLARMMILGGKHSVGGFEFNPMHCLAVFENMRAPQPKRRFCVGIEDDVSHTSLTIPEPIRTLPESTVEAKFYGLGSDGTVGSCKSAIQLIGEETPLFTQGYFTFDAKKTGGFTFSHLRFGKERIYSEYDIYNGDYVGCHQPSFLKKYNVTRELKPGGIFVLNTTWETKEQIEHNLPIYAKKDLAQKKAKFYTINAFDIAAKAGLTGRINMIMSVCFFALSNVLPVDASIELLKGSVRKMYAKKGAEVIQQNVNAIDQALAGLKLYDYDAAAWSSLVDPGIKKYNDRFLDDVVIPITRQEAHLQPVSAMTDVSSGVFRSGTSYVEKRGVANRVPHWNPAECIQCNQCSFVCPHSVIRPFVFDPVKDKAPETFKGVPLKGNVKPKDEGDWHYRIQLSARDCLECGLCVSECPKKCLTWRPFLGEDHDEEDANWEFAMSIPVARTKEAFTGKNVRDLQFQKPLLEFHAACAGCNQPGHMRVITQLFGSEIYVSNAVGCSMIWGGYTPASPYTTDDDGVGPVYATSLFENNAEFALGMSVSVRKRRATLKSNVEQCLALPDDLASPKLKGLFTELLGAYDDHQRTHTLALAIKQELHANAPAIEASPRSPLTFVYHNRDLLANKHVWVPGGDGWAYDIDFHGIDHLLHSGEDVNVLLLDTEVYSNTGGQASKATPRGAQAKLATAGKMGVKKDFGMYAMNLGCCYVASVCIGANRPQYIRAIQEAAAFKGPSVILAYCPCIAHSPKGGLTSSMEQQRLAVKGGYWPLYRFNPDLIEKGENPLQIDAKVDLEKGEWVTPLKAFLGNELRFTMGLHGGEGFEERVELIRQDIYAKTDKLQRMVSVFAPK